MWRGSVEAFPHLPAPPCLLKIQTWVMMITTWKVMWTRRLRRSFLSTCSLEQGLALDLPLSLLPEVAPVPPPPMENPLHPADLAVEHSPPDHHKALLLTSSLVPPQLKAWSPNVHLLLAPTPPLPDQHLHNAHHHLQVEGRQQQEHLDQEVLPDQISLLELG